MINAAKINTCDTRRYCTCNNTVVDWARPSAIVVSSTTRSECRWVLWRKMNVHKRMNDNNSSDTHMCGCVRRARMASQFASSTHTSHTSLTLLRSKNSSHKRDYIFITRIIHRIWGLRVHSIQTFCRKSEKIRNRPTIPCRWTLECSTVWSTVDRASRLKILHLILWNRSKNMHFLAMTRRECRRSY